MFPKIQKNDFNNFLLLTYTNLFCNFNYKRELRQAGDKHHEKDRTNLRHRPERKKMFRYSGRQRNGSDVERATEAMGKLSDPLLQDFEKRSIRGKNERFDCH